METVKDSRSLFKRVFFTRTGIHFARKRSKVTFGPGFSLETEHRPK